jgi:hypothetical protein
LAARYRDALAGRPGGAIGGEKGGDARDVVGLADAAQRQTGVDRLAGAFADALTAAFNPNARRNSPPLAAARISRAVKRAWSREREWV